VKNDIIKHLTESIDVKNKVISDQKNLLKIEMAAKNAIQVYKNGGKLLICGNGGSAADAQHFAGELVSKFYFDRPALNAIALTTDTSIITAIGNDYGYEKLFERQVSGLGKKGDLFIGITTSGNSKNVFLGLKKAKEMGLFTICLSGNKKGLVDEYSDILINIPSDLTPRIQETHIVIEHILCYLIEKEIFS